MPVFQAGQGCSSSSWYIYYGFTCSNQVPHPHLGAQSHKDGSGTLDLPFLQGHLIWVQSDNATSMAYLNHQGTTTSLAALKWVLHIDIFKHDMSEMADHGCRYSGLQIQQQTI